MKRGILVLAVLAAIPALPQTTVAAPVTSFRIAAAGDLCGNCKATSDLVVKHNPATVLTLGDNAYDSGTLQEYQHNYDPYWGRFKWKTHPSAGNHDYETAGAAGYRAYFGLGSGPLYGSFNQQGWHFARLDTEQLSSTLQENWLSADLTADEHRCDLVYGHYPRYSSGTTHGSTSELTNAWNIAANKGVDVWLAGHEHNYERLKRDGIREFVVGTGGAGSYPFGAAIQGDEKRITGTFGVLFMTLKPGSYSWRFRNTNGTILDSGSATCH